MNLDKSEERRRYHRILYTANANLSDGRESYPCKVLDLSLQGCLLRFEEPWTGNTDTLYTLSLQLSDSIDIKMELRICHASSNEIGCKCEHIDIDSISQLRRLIELNLGDSVLLERDLLALSGLDAH
ncbi:PilZ domain-containing protein [Methylomarinum vadi]|uniref:PilZ domain-containing protein n=1 Tax=Methylomarinum vadi TaxID=438855 RepID=UPI0004DEFA40|nr:PilZ domain-containing protein [Methylomarinum vadi]